MRVFDHIRLSLLRKAGLAPGPDLDEIRVSQWCDRFIELMRNRMVLGWFRYGPMRGLVNRWDNVGSAKTRLDLYLSDGNLEHLVDVANLCLLEFVKGPLGLGSHPNPKWDPEDDGYHTEEL